MIDEGQEEEYGMNISELEIGWKWGLDQRDLFLRVSVIFQISISPSKIIWGCDFFWKVSCDINFFIIYLFWF